jgi:hypothetical protein
MFFKGDQEDLEYSKYVDRVKVLSRQINELKFSEKMNWGRRIDEIKKIFEKDGRSKISKIISLIKHRINYKRLLRMRSPFGVQNRTYSSPDYFSKYKIAVYTCVFGKYDTLLEPICHPDNIDYYVITDNDLPSSSEWKKIDISPYERILEKMDNVEKNRWFKMNPFEIFSQYKYSVYIDGNIRPVSDFTEFINRLGSCGIGMFWHRANNCIYQEALFNKYLVKKVPDEMIDRQIKYLKSKRMPKNYGMTTCNIIAREHDNPTCRKLMKDWWSEFYHHCKRDQLSFPYVAWKNRIPMKEIAVLGDDAWKTDTLLIEDHIY